MPRPAQLAQGGAPWRPAATVVDPPERRCWRCLQMFAGDPDYVPMHAEFWLCPACAPKLLGSPREELQR